MSRCRTALAAAGAALVLLVAPASAAPTGPALERLVGQTILTGFSGRTPSASFLARVRAGRVGGVLLFGRNVGGKRAVAALVARLQAEAAAGGNPPLLVAVDQEGGPVKRFAEAPPDVSPSRLANGAEAESEAAATARFLRSVGVDVDLAPVLDTPSSPKSFLARRAFGPDPGENAVLGAAFVRGLQRGRVAATAKHFPGLGTVRTSTDRRRVVVQASRADLDRRLLPFRAALDEGVKLVMVSSAAYRAYDPGGQPASLSPTIVTTLLRGVLGYDGVVVTDAMEAPPLRVPDAAARAIGAGVDLLLYASEPGGAAAYDELLADAESGRVRIADLRRANERIARLKRWVAGA